MSSMIASRAAWRAVVCLSLGTLMVAHPSVANAGGTLMSVALAGGPNVRVVRVSADGSTVVGSVVDVSGATFDVVRWTQATGAQNLGGLGGTHAEVHAISADGQFIAGTSDLLGDSVSHAFRWSAMNGMQDLGALGGAKSAAASMSADGTTVVGGFGFPTSPQWHAFRWTVQTGMIDLGTAGYENSIAGPVSADGSVIAGSLYFGPCPTCSTPHHAFRWTKATGMQSVGTIGGAATLLSADGSTIAGTTDRMPPSPDTHVWRWTEVGGSQDLGTFGFTLVQDISSDGSVIVGTLSYDLVGITTRAFRSTSGNVVPLGSLGGGTSYASATNRDGSAVVGSSQPSYPGGPHYATLWTTALGLVDLNVYLPSIGVGLSGWVLSDAVGISGDGRTIAGNGMFNGKPSGYVVTICRADFNNDGFVTGDDYDAFVDAFVLGTSAADFNRDGFVTGDDFDFFADEFAAGC